MLVIKSLSVTNGFVDVCPAYKCKELSLGAFAQTYAQIKNYPFEKDQVDLYHGWKQQNHLFHHSSGNVFLQKFDITASPLSFVINSY